MRKFFVYISLLLCALVLCGCSANTRWALPERAESRIMEKRHPAALSAQESREMARYMCANRVFVTEGAVYSLDFDHELQPVLAVHERNGDSLSNFRVLAGQCQPEYLTMHEGKLYYINALAMNAVECLDTASGERRVLLEKPCSFLRVSEGRLWYCNEQGYFCSAGLDGRDEELLLEKSCCYPYVWGEAILYQNQEDGDRLHLCWPEDGTDITLTSSAAYAPQLIGERLYFTEGQRLRSIGIDGKEPMDYESARITGAAEFIEEDGRWFARCVNDGYDISQWSVALDGGEVAAAEYDGNRYCDYEDGNCRVDAVYFSDGRLRDFELITARGEKTRYIHDATKLPENPTDIPQND